MVPRHMRLWGETALAVAALFLGTLTLAVPDWIEVAFRVDPDAGSGAAEVLVAAGFLVLSVAMLLLARHEWRRALAAPTTRSSS